DAGLLHLEPHVGALASALADAGEHRDATVLLRDAPDHLLDDDRLADAGAAEQADLAALHVGFEQVDDLDAGLEHLRLRLELVERRGVAMDVPAVCDVRHLRLGNIERLADHVPHVPERAVADRHLQTMTEVAHNSAALQPVGRLEADRATAALADLLRDFGGNGDRLALELDVHRYRGVDLGQPVRRELDVDDGTEDRDDATILRFGLGFGRCCHRSPQADLS